jgi:hypothetical protein
MQEKFMWEFQWGCCSKSRDLYLNNFREFDVVGNSIFFKLKFWINCGKCICEVFVEDLIMCKTKMANWENLKGYDPTIFRKHHYVEDRFNK